MSEQLSDEQLAEQLADAIVELSPMVVGWEVDARTDTVQLTLPKRLRAGIDLTHLRAGHVEHVARRVVKAVERA